MTASIALLRAVNVGGRNRLAMAELRKALEDAGHFGVTTHIQSGNLILPAGQPGEAELQKLLRERFGLSLTVMLRTASELGAVLKHNPFAESDGVYVGFLKDLPSGAAHRDFGEEKFLVRGREIYLYYPAGMGRSRMTTAWFEKALGTELTARNWTVVQKLHELVTA